MVSRWREYGYKIVDKNNYRRRNMLYAWVFTNDSSNSAHGHKDGETAEYSDTRWDNKVVKEVVTSQVILSFPRTTTKAQPTITSPQSSKITETTTTTTTTERTATTKRATTKTTTERTTNETTESPLNEEDSVPQTQDTLQEDSVPQIQDTPQEEPVAPQEPVTELNTENEPISEDDMGS